MKKLRINEVVATTFEEGCNMYLLNCKHRNLREATINHYRQSYNQFYKYFDRDMLLSDINLETYNSYVVYLKETLTNDVSINSYLRDLITTIHFWQSEGYVEYFKMQAIKVDKSKVETYTDDEIKKLLKKPDLKKCNFTEYQCYVISNFLFSTGIRQRSLINIKIRDLDFDNNLVHIRVTKNRKILILPLNQTIVEILKQFLKHRQAKDLDDYLFCNQFGNQLIKGTFYHAMYDYNKRRGVEKTGLHRWRHTYSKQWILNGGNPIVLSQLLGHSNLEITQNYINLLTSDLQKEVEEIDILGKYTARKSIKIK